MTKTNHSPILFFFICLQLFSIDLYGCTCGYYEPVFCRELKEDENVLKVVIEEFYINNSHPDFLDRMRVKVLENIHLTTSHDTLLIIGQDGLNCAAYLNQFNISDTLILGTYIHNDTTYSYLNGCGLSFLRFENDSLYGQITDDLTVQSIEDFKTNLFTCLDLEVPIEKIEINDEKIEIFPNPFSEKITIKSNNHFFTIELIDLNGKIFKTISNNINSFLEINTYDLENGIYFLRITSEKGILTKKIIKMPIKGN